LLVGRAKYPGKDELRAMREREPGTSGSGAAAKHKKQTYGRKLAVHSALLGPASAERERTSGIPE